MNEHHLSPGGWQVDFQNPAANFFYLDNFCKARKEIFSIYLLHTHKL